MSKLFGFTALFILCISCGKSDTPSDKKGEEEKSEDSLPVKPTDSAKPSLRPIPALDFAQVSVDRMRKARSQNSEALEKQKAKDYDGAIASYHAALVTDPGHIKARYNLATALALANKNDQAIAILKEFAGTADCVPCIGRLVRAANDSDFDTIKNDPVFVELTKSAKIAKFNVEKASADFLDGVLDEKKRELAVKHVYARDIVELVTTSGNCDGDDCVSKTSLVGPQALRQEIGEWYPIPAKVKKCDKNCCTIDYSGQQDGDVATGLDRVCFSRDSGGVLSLAKVVLTDGP